MAEGALKRQRADSQGTAVKLNNRESNHASTIRDLPERVAYQILAKAAASHEDVAALVRAAVANTHAAEKSKVDFDHHSKSVWRHINVKYSRLSGSHQSDASGDPYHYAVECIESIREECPNFASFGTKKNALEVCRKIGKTICLSGDVIGTEVRGLFRGDDTLKDTMTAIAESLTSVEKKIILTDEWYDKLDELIRLANGCYIFDGLQQVLDVLDNETHDDDESVEDDDEDGDEDEGEKEDEDGGEDEEEEWEWR